jgi:hypothetical protein
MVLNFSSVVVVAAEVAGDIQSFIEKWDRMKARVKAIKIPKDETINVVYRKEPFEYVETIEVLTESGRLPLRGVAFDLEKSRVVVIQNLFDTAGAQLSSTAELQFKKMLRNLLPRRSLQKSFELEVVGFTDIQNFGEAFAHKNCDFLQPRNNACLGLARATNTTLTLDKYVRRTLGSQLPIIKKYDPDPLMHNLNLRSDGKIWTATGAGDTAAEISQLLSFQLKPQKTYSSEDIKKIRAEANKVIKRIGSNFENLLQPFRCAIVIAWRS